MTAFSSETQTVFNLTSTILTEHYNSPFLFIISYLVKLCKKLRQNNTALTVPYYYTIVSISVRSLPIILFSSLEIYDCDMPSLSATSFCVISSFPERPNLKHIIVFSREFNLSTRLIRISFSLSFSIIEDISLASLPRTSERSSSFPSQSTFSGSSIDISFLSPDYFLKCISISFSIHLEA